MAIKKKSPTKIAAAKPTVDSETATTSKDDRHEEKGSQEAADEMSEARKKLIEYAVRKVQTVADRHHEEVSSFIRKLGEQETAIQGNAKVLAEKLISLEECKAETKRTNEELLLTTSLILNVAKDQSKLEFDEQNILSFVKEENALHGKWLRKWCKKSALSECIMQLKKAFEEGRITLRELLEQTRKLHCKQFRCLHLMKSLEQCLQYP